MLDQNAPVPLYFQVQQQLLLRLRGLRPGTLLPTQKALAEEFGASLITIRRAVDELARLGFVEATRGRGTVVVRPSVRDDRGEVSSWTDSMTRLGRQPSTAWRRISAHVPSREVARTLALKARERTVVVERLRTLDGEPFCLMRNELPLSVVPGLLSEGLAGESLYTWVSARYGLRPHRAVEEVEARIATEIETQALAYAGIVMVVRRQSYLADGRPMEVAEIVAPADRYQYRVEVVRRT